MNNKKKGPKSIKTLIAYALIFIVIVSIITAYRTSGLKANVAATEITYSEFVAHLENQDFTAITIFENSYKYQAVLKNNSVVVCYAPSSYDMMLLSEKYIVEQAAQGLIKVDSVKPSALSGILSWLPTILMIVFMVIIWRSLMGGAGGKGVMSFGKLHTKNVAGDDNKVTFKDVAGLEEEKQELSEIVDFLKNPKKYTELGARIPKGVLLVGPPGTGKTFISKAVAGEAGVPFFSISGSDFVEMFVGVGASRVRDLFDEAKKNAPCIVFIDEIDAVGRRRGAGIGGGNDEREQTLNQLLVEMDGFGRNEGIIILAATNRPDVLDPAILRPGRFDRQVTISTPDVKGREAVFEIYAKGKPIDSEVDLKTLAKRTPGFTPADIENMMNEAALLTARRNGSLIHMDDIEEAITRVIAGPEKRSRVMTEKERKLTAFHEAGHAVIARSIPGFDPVHQVTIMPRGMAGGFTMNLPEEDKFYATRGEMLDEITDLLGGRVAEKLTLEDISTGASNDLERATKIAHDMVVKYGMTDAIGPVNYSDADEVFLGRDFTSKQNFSESLAAKIDEEVRRIMDDCYDRAKKILSTNLDKLNAVANALLELETLDKDEFEAIFTGTKTIDEIKAASDIAKHQRKQKEEIEAKERAKKEEEEKAKAEENLAEEIKKGTRVVMLGKDGSAKFIRPDEIKRFGSANKTPKQESPKAEDNMRDISKTTPKVAGMFDSEEEVKKKEYKAAASRKDVAPQNPEEIFAAFEKKASILEEQAKSEEEDEPKDHEE